jgi:hypothetical protein
MDKTTEVEQLRARVAELEARLSSAGGQPTEKPAPTTEEPAAGRSGWRTAASALVITLACVLAPLSVAAAWASLTLSDTDQYVETVAPLAEDPAVRSAVSREVTSAVLSDLQLEQVTTDALDALAQQENVPPRVAAALPALAVPITNGVENFARTQVDNALATPQFAVIWAEVNRLAHEQVVTLLEGTQGGAVSAQGDTVTLNLAPVIAEVKQRLVGQGFTLASNIPEVNRSFVLVQSDAIGQAQGAYRLLNTLGAWLSVIALALFAAGVYLAGDRRRALLRGALGVTAAMVVLGVALGIARQMYVDSTPANILTAQAAGSVFDTLVRFLRTGLRAAAVLGLVVALAAFLTGPSTAAVRTRTTVQRGIDTLRGRAETSGMNLGVVGTWSYAHKSAVRVGVLVVAGVTLVFWSQPTVMVVIVAAVLVVVALAVVEFLARPGEVEPSVEDAEAPRVPEQRGPTEEANGSSIATTPVQGPARPVPH